MVVVVHLQQNILLQRAECQVGRSYGGKQARSRPTSRRQIFWFFVRASWRQLSAPCAHAQRPHNVNPGPSIICLAQVREGELATAEGVSYLEAKHLLLLHYCTAIVFYLLLKAVRLERGAHVAHPVLWWQRWGSSGIAVAARLHACASAGAGWLAPIFLPAPVGCSTPDTSHAVLQQSPLLARFLILV